MVHSKAVYPSAEVDMLQLSVIRTEGDGVGTGTLQANSTMEHTVSEVLVTLTGMIRPFLNKSIAQHVKDFHTNADVSREL